MEVHPQKNGTGPMSPKKHATPSSDDSEQCAKYLKAIADPIRLQIIRALRGTPLTVSDLSLLLEMEVANISHHLRVLYHADLVETRRDGRFIYYELNRKVLASKSLPQTFEFGCCSLKMT